MIVTLFAWIAQRFVSSKRPTRYASDASWRAAIADDWKRRSPLKPEAISLTSLWNGSFLMRRSVLFWYFLISRSATVPGRKRCCFFAPCESIVGVDLRAALAPRDLRGVLPPVDFLAVCFVRASLKTNEMNR